LPRGFTDAMVGEAKAHQGSSGHHIIEITREDYANAGVLLADKK